MLTSTPEPENRENTVKTTLTPTARRQPVENKEYDAFVRRIVRAYAKRVAQGDIAAFADMVALADLLNRHTREAVTGLRHHGYSWADIGRPVGLTKQAAQQRWGGDPK